MKLTPFLKLTPFWIPYSHHPMNPINHNILFILVGCCGLSVASRHMGPREARPISANHSLNLSDREVVKMTNRANKGDGDAALRLYMHYAFAQSDSHTGIYWLEKAAESGNETAKHNLRVLALEWPDGIPASKI